MRIGIAQLNMIVWDIPYNVARIKEAYNYAHDNGVDLLITPELSVTGYTPEDMLLGDDWHSLQADVFAALCQITAGKRTGLLVGMPISAPATEHTRLYNAAVLFAEGKEVGRHYKHHLPNYGVFDEARYFHNTPLSQLDTINFAGQKLGVMICEDMWYDDVSERMATCGADFFIALNASPYELGKRDKRLQLARRIVSKYHKPLVYTNLLGGQDELIFDGASFVLDADGNIATATPPWKEEIAILELTASHRNEVAILEQDDGDIYQALMLALRDYVKKNNFASITLGLSGGMDSSFVTVLASDALGADLVSVAMLPSKYTSNESHKDAIELINKLGCKYYDISIKQLYDLVTSELSKAFNTELVSLTNENLQARLRGLLLMAISNQKQPLLLATGNKSEYAVGYATIYGDMCGGFAPIKDIYKTMVYRLARWRNNNIPSDSRTPHIVRPFSDSVLLKAPTAELKANQKDEDNLPPYDVLDLILAHLIEGTVEYDELKKQGISDALVMSINDMLRKSEFKRRQAAIGPKITSKSFGKDWRYPITMYKRKG